MRITIVTRNARIVGGVESYLDVIIPLLQVAGNEVSLFCEHNTPLESRTISLGADAPTWCVAEMGAEHSLESLRRWRPDLIYSHGLADLEIEAKAFRLAPVMVFVHDYRAICVSGTKTFAFPATTPCLRRLGLGCLVNFYPRRCGGLNPMTMLTDFRQAGERLALLRSVRAILTASNYVRAEHVRNGLSPKAVRCVGLPVIDRGDGPRTTSYNSVRGLSATPVRMLFAGRMEASKGGQILLEALPLVSSALAHPLVLTFAGDGGARFEWARRADAISRSNPAVQVKFTGWLDSTALTSLFDSSDLLVVPSIWPEPFGLVGPEAGARGLPASAFAAGGIPEWLTDGVNGTLAQGVSRSPSHLADAIVRCLRDPAEHMRLRRGAIEMAKRFSPERHLDVLTKTIEEISAPAALFRPESAIS
jgi:glycosyltransferase involved in cell wall biosynthesis